MLQLIKLENNNHIFLVNHINEYLNPLYIYIPIFDKTTFKMKDYVYKNTLFGDEVASVSGNILGSKKIIVNKKHIPALKIKNDFKENNISKKRVKKINSKEELIELLNNFNLKDIANIILSKQNIKNFIVSSIDEEIYAINEFIILSNYYNEILDTIEYLLKLFSLDKSLILTKNTNSKSIKNVKSIIGTYPKINISLVPDKYIISRDEFICKYLNISLDETLILKTSEIYKIYKVLLKAKMNTETIITISGDAIEKSLVINTKIGVSLKELLDEFIKFICDDYEVYVNGYLSGIKIENIDEVIITKNTSSIVINKSKKEEESSCINCGACKKICPVNINVKYCYFNKLSHKNCIKCGLCNYVCPARLKLKEIVMSDAK